MKRRYAFALSATLAACSGTNGTFIGPAPDITTGLRDARYCEVIPSVQSGQTVNTYIYNTLGYSDCPAAQWNALTIPEVNQEFGSQTAQLNGPRHWVLDAISASGSSQTGKTFTFGGLEMGLRGVIQTAVGQPTVGQQFYVPNEVQRDTIWIYDAGKPIFELTAPNGDVYVMQSYAQIADATLTYAQLPSLGTKLALPAGWSYSTETLTSTLNLNSNGLATVINDNLGDSYQRR